MKRACISLTLLFGCTLLVVAQGNWLRDLGILGDDTRPKYEKIEFWDPQVQEQRTIRALFYTVLPDKRNKALDLRLHTQMAQYLNVICGTVITLETFDNPAQQQMIEGEIVNLLDEFQLAGRVNPAPFFQQLPFLDVDIVIFMERSLYDPSWKGNDKFLNIGVDLAAVEMDLGEPVFSERFTRQVPWSEKDASYIKAEQQALLDAANAMGKQFQQVADMINQLRERERDAEMKAAEFERRETRERLRNEDRAYRALAAEGIRMLNQRSEPAPMLQSLAARLEAFIPLVNEDGLPEPQQEMKRRLAQDVAFTMQAILDWVPPEAPPRMAGPPDPLQGLSNALREDATVAVSSPADLQSVDLDRDPASPTPTPQPFRADPLLPLPEVPNLLQGIFDRSWLIPDGSSAARPAMTPVPSPTASP